MKKHQPNIFILLSVDKGKVYRPRGHHSWAIKTQTVECQVAAKESRFHFHYQNKFHSLLLFDYSVNEGKEGRNFSSSFFMILFEIR